MVDGPVADAAPLFELVVLTWTLLILALGWWPSDMGPCGTSIANSFGELEAVPKRAA